MQLQSGMPGVGRLDLRYVIESSPDALNWTEIAGKEGYAAWAGPTTVTMTPLLGHLHRAQVSLPLPLDRDPGFFRLRIERLGASLV